MRTAREFFKQKAGDVTKAYYAQLNELGLQGQLAVALFRAQKRSEAAKSYRGGRHRRGAYEVKNWSLGEVCRVMSADGAPGFVWGWKVDHATPGYPWVLYVELPSGQISFHSAERLHGPEFLAEFDGARLSRERILVFCDAVMSGHACSFVAPPPPVEQLFLGGVL